MNGTSSPHSRSRSAPGSGPRPHRTKSQRRLTWGRRLLYRIAVVAAFGLVQLLWYSARIRRTGDDRLAQALRQHGAVIPVCWHQHLLVCGRFIVSAKRKYGLKPGFMISPSVDGEAPTMLARAHGAHVVRGSGSYTGVRALRGVHQAIVKEGISPLITPDGPRGPRFVFKPGAIFTAQISGKPVVPLAFAAQPSWVLKTWDKFVFPAPFAKICIAVGEPFYVPAEVSDGEMQAAQEEMKRRMHETYKEARKMLSA